MWIYVVVVAVLAIGVWGFISAARFATRFLSRHSDRTTDTMYQGYNGPPKKQRRRPG